MMLTNFKRTLTAMVLAAVVCGTAGGSTATMAQDAGQTAGQEREQHYRVYVKGIT
jgi:uncharacterized membrane protein